MRFGPVAGATWAAITTATSNGSVNCMHDSLNPLAGLAPLTGMRLNCVFGGIGVGFVNMLMYLIVAVFLAGLMVGRTPEYLGKKVEAREMKLAMLADPAPPAPDPAPARPVRGDRLGRQDDDQPRPARLQRDPLRVHLGGGQQRLGLRGAGATTRPPWNIATGIVLLLGRFPAADPARWRWPGSWRPRSACPLTTGTLRTDTLTFALMLLGTVLLVGALLFMPAAVLGPVADTCGHRT